MYTNVLPNDTNDLSAVVMGLKRSLAALASIGQLVQDMWQPSRA